MAALKHPFLDTGILLSGLIDFCESSRASMKLLDRIAEKRIRNAATAWHCCLEFYSVATRLPEEYRLDVDTAEKFVAEEIMGGSKFTCWMRGGGKVFSPMPRNP